MDINDLANSEGLQDLEKNKDKIALDLRISLFKEGIFNFITEGIANNSEGNFVKGEVAMHEKQHKALQILTSNKYDLFLYGGAAGGSKSFTGMSWILLSALAYRNTRYFIARNQLKDIRESVMVTFDEVCDLLGITSDMYKYNSIFNTITFPNKSVINLIEVSYKPSDPEYKVVGSTLYTSGWFEEVSEIDKKAVSVLSTRINRWNVEEHGLTGIVFLTGNPANNWVKEDYYDKDINGEMEEDNKDPDKFNKKFLSCLVTENPFMTEKYISSLRKQASNDIVVYERLFKGNWDYADNPYQLAEQEMIDEVFSNDHVSEGMSYITADVAFQGADLAVIIAWKGWVAKEVVTKKISDTLRISNEIMLLRRKYRVPKSRVIVDADGAGIGVVDITGAVKFHNGGKVLRQGKDSPNYKNLQVQCLYLLADKINEGGLYIEDEELDDKQKGYIKQELAQIQSVENKRDADKLNCKLKSDIKRDIGRSPDYRDALLMRVWFDLKPKRRMMLSSKPRNLL